MALPELKAEPGCCEEASPASRDFYIPCNRMATCRVYLPRDDRTYRMCEMCADHNLRRGGVNKGPFVQELKIE